VVWRFWGVPGPGDFGHDTWEGESWRTGGAVPWIHPAIDPELGLVYWTFGNPYPRTDGSSRGGDNLFSNSIVAIEAKTGERRWHFQSVHHDIWDYDNVMAPVLADIEIEGRLRKVVVYGCKTCYYYILDRATGEPVHGMEERPVPQDARQKTARTQPFPGGEPFVHPYPNHGDATRPVPFYPVGGLFGVFWDRATILYPGAGGGADWSHLSFNPVTGWIYLGYGLVNSSFSNVRDGRVNTSRPIGEHFSGGIAALDPRTNTVAWRQEHPWSICHGNGILTTRGGVMFQGWPDGLLNAFDDRTGEALWSFQTGAGVHTSPIAYEIDGEQYIAVFAGGNRLPYKDIPLGDHLWAFRLGGSVAPAAAPKPPSKRNDVAAAPVSGEEAQDTVTLGRIWNTETKRPGAEENLVAENAMAPQHLRISVGTTVTFVNPSDNKTAHAAVSFWEPEFDTGVLLPGQSFRHAFNTAGEFFYNDALYPQNTGKIVVY
jgi:outer membrane protein assembly factor BamB